MESRKRKKGEGGREKGVRERGGGETADAKNSQQEEEEEGAPSFSSFIIFFYSFCFFSFFFLFFFFLFTIILCLSVPNYVYVGGPPSQDAAGFRLLEGILGLRDAGH